MPPACLDYQKKTKIRKKIQVLAICGPQAPSGPISAQFPGVVRCAAGWREALITLAELSEDDIPGGNPKHVLGKEHSALDYPVPNLLAT